MPRAFPILEMAPLIESEYYPRDLLLSVLALSLGHPQMAQYKSRILLIAQSAFEYLKAQQLVEFEKQFLGRPPADFGLTAEAYKKSKRSALAEIEKSKVGKELTNFIEVMAQSNS